MDYAPFCDDLKDAWARLDTDQRNLVLDFRESRGLAPMFAEAGRFRLYAVVRKDSKYFSHNDLAKERGEFPFPIVEVAPDKAPSPGFCFFGGPGGNYRSEDLDFYVFAGGEYIRL